MRHKQILTTRLASGKRDGSSRRGVRGGKFAKAKLAVKKARERASASFRSAGYDPDMLYVECGRCGAPVLWEPGRAGALLREAGVDPAELDAACMLVTDACPACGSGDEYSVRIFRVSAGTPASMPPTRGHA